MFSVKSGGIVLPPTFATQLLLHSKILTSINFSFPIGPLTISIIFIMAPKRPGDFDDTRPNKYSRTMNGDTQMVPYNPFRGGRRWSSARNAYVPMYTGSHGPRRNFKKKKSGPYSLLTRSDATRHQNPKYPIPEIKQLDLTYGTTAAPISIPAAGIFFFTGTNPNEVWAINQITQGVANSNRVGASVTIISVAFRLDFDLGATPTTTSFRHILLWDRQPNNYVTDPAVVDVLQTASLTSFLAFDNVDRFVILRNQLLTLSPNGQETQFIDGFVKVNMKSRYVNTTTIEPNSGALLALFISDQGTAANQPTVNGNYRVRFKDN